MTQLTNTQRAGIQEWLKTGEKGISSKVIANAFLGQAYTSTNTPWDYSDFNRCVQLINIINPCIEQLELLGNINDDWYKIVTNWTELFNLWENDNHESLYNLLTELRDTSNENHLNKDMSLTIGKHTTLQAGIIYGDNPPPTASGVPNDVNGEVETMTPPPADKEHNQTAVNISPTGQRLRAIINRVEHLEEEKKEKSDDIKEVLAEAKGDGFDVKTIRKIIQMRKKDPSDIAEESDLIDTYMSSMGMRYIQPSLFKDDNGDNNNE